MDSPQPTAELSTLLDQQPLRVSGAFSLERAAWVLVILIALLTRFYMLGERVISHDESLHTYYSWQLYRGQGFQHTPLMHGPFQFHVVALSYFLFGANDFTSRVPAALFGVGAVALLWWFRPWLGRKGALAAAAMLTISPYMLYYARYVRNEAFVVVWALLMALATLQYFADRRPRWLYLMALAIALNHATKETAFIYDAIWLLFLAVLYAGDLWRGPWRTRNMHLLFWSLSAGGLIGSAAVGGVMFAALLVVPAGIALAVLAFAALVGALVVALRGLPTAARVTPSFDLLIVMGTLVLPQLVAFPVKLLLHRDPLDYTPAGMWVTGPALAAMVLLSAAVGLLWDRRRWPIIAAIFAAIYLTLFTTMFTNGQGVATGIVGSLGYWLDQHGVQRGSQPWYYYAGLQLPYYEFLPALGGLLACAATLLQLRPRAVPAAPAEPRPAFPTIAFLCFWSVLALVAYSTAGEKMPWLTVHIALPLILAGSWIFGNLLEQVPWAAVWQKQGWILLLVLPLATLAGVDAASRLAGLGAPFQSTTLEDLQHSMAFLSATTVLAGTIYGLVYAVRQLGARVALQLAAVQGIALLAVLTLRSAILANYINFDYQTEFINYASGAPGVRVVMAQVEEISRRTTDGLDIKIAFDSDVSWPFTWYLRNYPNQVYYAEQPTRESFRDVPLVIAGDNSWARVEPLLGNNYHSFEYIRMWWPMQDYFDLTPARVRANLLDPVRLNALWNIWQWRDYKAYGELNGTSYALAQWPVVDRMRLYIRKDVASKIWSLGVGPSALTEALPPDPFETLLRRVPAAIFVGAAGSAPGQLKQPRDVAVAPNGSVVIADTFNHRIQSFAPDGSLLASWGTFGAVDQGGQPGQLNEPWGVAVNANGEVYVADTWNHRVQHFDSAGKLLGTWGAFGNGTDLLNLWGPRDVAIDSTGLVYVSDTGNKRISVFDAQGAPLRQIGAAGALDGELDEPVGIAISPAGELYVADAWNRRIQVFGLDGVFRRKWDVSGWYGQSLFAKPYLTVDANENVYFSDPEGFRIFVTDRNGLPLRSFGDYGADASALSMPTGLAASSDGLLYIADADNQRVVRIAIDQLQIGSAAAPSE